MFRPLLIAVAAAVPLQPATAGSGAGGVRIGVQGSVPVVCRATIEPAAETSPGRIAGWLVELCNNPGGHSVYLDHSRALAGATAMVDGIAVPLSDSGVTLVAQSPVPTRTRKAFKIEFTAADAALTVRLVPN